MAISCQFFFINRFLWMTQRLHAFSFSLFSSVQCFAISLPLKYNNPTIMVVQVVETLGGFVTCEGHSCTHIVTGKARRTMNFCVALSSGYMSLSLMA